MRRSAFLIVLLGLAWTGCDNTVDPFEETDRAFTVFGYLDTASDTQFVRVIPFRRDIGGTEPRELDAEVSVIEQETGVAYAMRDSVIEFADGSVGHVFHAPFRPQPGLTYRITIARQGEVSAWAETTVPPAERVVVGEPNQFAPEGITQFVSWQDVDFEPFRVEVWYRFARYPASEPFKDLVVTYDDPGRMVEDGWRVTVNLSRDADLIRPRVGAIESLLGVGMRLTMTDEKWRPPGGVFDEDVLVQPGAFSNVTGGFGFFGSVNQYTVEWVLSDLITRRLDFAAP